MDIERTNIKEAVDAEVSKVADLTYDNEGNSRYDGIIITSSDEPLIDGYIDDAVLALQKRLIDVASVSEDASKKITITTSNPNANSGTDDALAASVLRYLSLNVCAAWFQTVLPERVEEYAARGQVAMDEAIALMLHRTTPTITRE